MRKKLEATIHAWCWTHDRSGNGLALSNLHRALADIDEGMRINDALARHFTGGLLTALLRTEL